MNEIVSLPIVQYCAEEVDRQMDSPLAVAWMVRAWAKAIEFYEGAHPLTQGVIETLGQIIKPHKNASGFRTVQVWVGSAKCPPPQEVRPMMQTFVAQFEQMTPAEAYLEFERCHPFVDGNGRCGKIILCWRAGTLRDPYQITIPNPWNIANP